MWNVVPECIRRDAFIFGLKEMFRDRHVVANGCPVDRRRRKVIEKWIFMIKVAYLWQIY